MLIHQVFYSIYFLNTVNKLYMLLFSDLETFIIQEFPISSFLCKSFALLRQKIEQISVYHPGVTGWICSQQEDRLENFFFHNYIYSVCAYTSSLHHMGFFLFQFAQNLCMQTATAHLIHTILSHFSLKKICIFQVLQNYQILFHCTSKWVKTFFQSVG